MIHRRAGKIRVAVVFGGRSPEHSISCLSAASIMAALDRSKYDVVAVGITRAGSWHFVSSDPADWQRRGDVLPTVTAAGPVAILATTVGATQTPTDVTGTAVAAIDDPSARLVEADVVFPVLHGEYGEDGTIQGALELSAVPYVGSGVLSSAATMDKQVTKVLLAATGLPVGGYVTVTDRQWRTERDDVLARVDALGYPVFVKPARAGSSLGITKVHRSVDVVDAVEAARVHDKKLIIEESVEDAREIECGVLAGRGIEGPRASVCAEISVGGDHEFYDFVAKYVDDTTVLTVPADIPDPLHRELQRLAAAAFDALGCAGLARVDFFVGPRNTIWINEVNTMPGFTSVSLFPLMWQASGLDYSSLVDELITLALQTQRTNAAGRDDRDSSNA